MNHGRLRATILALSACAALAGAARAAEPATRENEPIRITALKMEVKAEQNTIIFEENVVAVQGDVTITADRLKILTAKGEDRKVQEMTATGNVQFRQYFPKDKVERFATGEKAQYWDAEGKLVLTGNPKAWENNNIITGDVMTFFTRQNVFLVDGKKGEGEKKVNVVFYPGKGQADLLGAKPASRAAGQEPPPAKTPASPGSLKVSETSPGEVHLSWKDNSDDEEGFLVERSAGGREEFAKIATVAAGASEYLDRNLPAAGDWVYRVSAFNAAGNSAPSATAGVTSSQGSSPGSAGGGGP